MSSMISYSIGYTAIDAAGTTVTVTPPPGYSAGDLLVMGVIAGGTSSSVVSAGTPSGWTARSSGGAGLGVFTKTAGSEPPSYTVTLSGTSTSAVFIAAYPAGTVVSSAFHASSSDVTEYAPAFPSGVTSGETVLLIAGAVASPADVNSNSGYQNVVIPSPWTTEVPVFGPALPDNTSNVSPVAIGLSDILGSTSAPALSSPQGCTIYAGYLVLSVTGTSTALAVTATVAYPQGTPGLALTVKALAGAASVAAITAGGATEPFYANSVSQAPQAAITPNASGSLVYGAVTENFGVTGGSVFTANASTTFSQNVGDATWSAIYGTLRSAGTTTASTPVTLGGSAPVNSFTTAALAEILAAPGHSLTETATVTAAGTVPGNFASTAVAQTAIFPSAPAPGTLLVAMVSANSLWGNGGSGSHNAVVTVTDSLGLTWTPLIQSPYPSYSGVWVASLGALTASASATVTPVRTATARRGHHRTASLTVTPSRTASRVAAHFRAAMLAVIPSRAATGEENGPGTHTRSASLAVTPSLAASRARGCSRTASLTVTPVRSASAGGVPRPASASLTVTPSRSASAVAGGLPPAHAVLDEGGAGILDEGGSYVLDETGSPVPPAVTGTWSAARAGLPGDTTATNWASQAGQFLTAHGIQAVYGGNRAWTSAVPSPSVSGAFSWLGQPAPGWLPAYDVSQPFALPAGVTTVGRVQVPVLASGNGADLQVLLCADNGSGSPVTGSPLASVIIPACHVTATSPTGSLASAGPLATASANASLLGAFTSGPWTQPAGSANGVGSFATPATSGNYTALIGGYDPIGNAALGFVATIAYQGSSVSGGITQPALPQPCWNCCAAITTDSVVVAGGRSVSTDYATVWTAPWTPGTGSVGAWSAQQALPAANVYGAMAAWGTQVYVIGGSTDGTAVHATSAVRTAASQSGQVTAWTSCPPLPQPLMQAYAAVVGNWLIVAGGVNTSNAAVTATWYTAINSDGSLAGWQQGPQLTTAAAAYAPGWNLAVTDSAMVIVSGFGGGVSFTSYAQSLAVSPDGVADAWQAQDLTGSAASGYQAAAYPAGPSGQWQVFGLLPASYITAPLRPVPLVSVPLPATGLTSGAKYHVVMRQLGGSLSDSLNLGVMQSGGTGWLYAPRGSEAPWTSTAGQQVAVNVYDGSAAGNALHLVQDSGAGLTTLVRSGATSLLTGVMEMASFPSESPEAVLGTVTEVTWNGGLPSGLVTLA